MHEIYETILEGRLREKVEKELEENQSGFRRGRSTQDHIFTIRQIIEKYRARNKEVFMCYIDLEKAFDRVNRKMIWKTLEKLGIGEELKEAVRSIYHKNQNYVRTRNMTSEIFTTNEGVRQGGTLSPLLFITALDEVIKKSVPEMKKLCVGYKNMQIVSVNICAFADDMVLFAENERDLQHNINILAKQLAPFNLKINEKKTKVMRIAKEESERHLKIETEGKEIEQVSQYKYLGAIVEESGSLEGEINNRVTAASKVFHSLRTKFLNNKEVSKKTKIVVFDAIYIPTLTYGSETWVTNKRQESRLQAAEMKYLRRTEGVSMLDKIRNTDIRKNLGVAPIKKKIEGNKLRWLGHLNRMKETRLTKRIWEARPVGKRGRGRPAKTWNETIGEILKNSGIDFKEAKTKSADRSEWRKWVNDSTKG